EPRLRLVLTEGARPARPERIGQVDLRRLVRDLEVLRPLGAERLEVAGVALLGLWPHRKVGIEDALDRPLDIGEGGVERGLVDGISNRTSTWRSCVKSSA